MKGSRSRSFIFSVCLLFMLLLSSFTAFAGSWQADGSGYWWLNDDGTYPASTWLWIDDDGDGGHAHGHLFMLPWIHASVPPCSGPPPSRPVSRTAASRGPTLSASRRRVCLAAPAANRSIGPPGDFH